MYDDKISEEQNRKHQRSNHYSELAESEAYETKNNNRDTHSLSTDLSQLLKAKGWLSFIGVANIIIGLMLFISGVYVLAIYLKGNSVFYSIPSLPLFGVCNIILAAGLVLFGTCYIRSSIHLTIAKITDSREEYKLSLSIIADIFMLQGTLLVVWVLYSMLLFSIYYY
jgi:hypothetical protein